VLLVIAWSMSGGRRAGAPPVARPAPESGGMALVSGSPAPLA
jgi:hypothetical protein